MSARFSLRRKEQPLARPSPDDPAVTDPAGHDALEYGYDTATAGGQETGSYQFDEDPTFYEPEAYVADVEDDESWLAPDTRRRVKIAVPTFALGALVVIAGAFWGGAEVDQHFGNHSSTSAAGLAAALGRRAAGGSTGTGGGGGGFAGLAGAGGGFGGGGFGASAPTASGTVTAISGGSLTVTTTTGSKARVMLTPSTIVTRIGEGSAGPLRVGDTVRVEGSKASDGTVTATAVTAIAAGVSRGGGFGGAGAPGFGTRGAGTAGGSTTRPTVHNGGFSGDGNGVSG